ncbi:MAG: acylphosphatase [Chloroflexi bacterium]|nr:acylphosphatase [Chloroflexota bacterium]
MEAQNEQQLHAIIRGRVQGVNFRYYTMQTARELELTGWVRNLIEGTVEVTAEGPRHRLERLLRFLYTGPTNARVEDVEVEWRSVTHEYDSFNIR